MKLEARDVLALAVIISCTILVLYGFDGVCKGILAGVSASYFTPKIGRSVKLMVSSKVEEE